jgi:uncharacterized protein (TIGR02265 family)
VRALDATAGTAAVERDALQRGLAWLGPEHRTCAPLFSALHSVVRAWGGEAALGALAPQPPAGGWGGLAQHGARDYLRLLAACAGYLEATLGSRSLALQCLGAESARAYLAAPGGPLARAVAARDAEALREALPAALDAALGFGRRRAYVLGLRHWRLACSADPLPPDFYLGLLQRLLLEVDVDGEVRAHTRGLGDVHYELSWQPPAFQPLPRA